MFRMIPPAGTPASFLGIINIVAAWFDRSTTCQFEEELLKYTGSKKVFFISSGQAAQYLLLKSFSTLVNGKKNEVVIPAYTCYTVAASIARAGLKIHPVDINPSTLDYNYDKLYNSDLSNVLAINSSNLFGILSDWSSLSTLAAKHDLFTIDDAAQSFGSKSKEKMSGTNGDGGFYSLGRGKNMSAWSGGLLMSSNQKVIDELANLVKDFKNPGLVNEITIFIKYIISSILLHPALYRLPASLPFLRLGETIYDESFEIESLTKAQIAIARVGLKKLDQLNKQRSTTAHSLANALIDSGRYEIPGYCPDKQVNYLRLPVLAESNHLRNKIISKLANIGVVASKMYPSSISKISQVQSILVGDKQFPGADTVVDRLFTLPTLQYVTRKDIDRIIDCLTKI